MSTLAQAPVAPTGASEPAAGAGGEGPKQGMSKGKKLGLGVAAAWLAGIVFFAVIYGVDSHKAHEVANGVFSPTNEFKLDTWFKVGPIAFNKAILYVLMTGIITVGLMWWVTRRARQRPGRMQVAIEWAYSMCQGLSHDNLAKEQIGKYFPLIMTLFMFILVTNLLGYIPLPVNSVDKFKLFGSEFPSFQIYAADTNVGFPLILSLMVFGLFTFEGIKAHGPFGYLKSLMPPGVTGAMKPFIFGLEIVSNLLRLVSLTVRLWANLLAGHMLIAFMSGELGVLVGQVVVVWALLPVGIGIYLFEALLIAGLQAFIFAILTAIYLGGAVEGH